MLSVVHFYLYSQLPLVMRNWIILYKQQIHFQLFLLITESIDSTLLIGAVNSADSANRHAIYEIVKWLTTERNVPPKSWQCTENVVDWLHDKDGIRTKWVDKMEKEYIWKALKA